MMAMLQAHKNVFDVLTRFFKPPKFEMRVSPGCCVTETSMTVHYHFDSCLLSRDAC